MENGPNRRSGQADAPAEARQRWRLTFCRGRAAPRLAQREYVAAWEDGLAATALPVLMGSGANPRPRLAFAAALPVGMAAEHELADLLLAARLPVRRVREALQAHLPEGHELLDVHDVWLGEPGVQAQVVAADYRVTLADDPPPTAELQRAARVLLDARELPRSREKGGGTVPYDLRPLLGDVQLVEGTPIVLRVRTMFHVERGSGRPEEVLAALGDELGREVQASETIRERVVLDNRPARVSAPPTPPGGSRRRPGPVRGATR